MPDQQLTYSQRVRREDHRWRREAGHSRADRDAAAVGGRGDLANEPTSDNDAIAPPHVGSDGVDRVEQEWRRERPDIDVSSFGVVTRIWRIGRHLEQQRKQQLTLMGTDRGTMDVLAMLRRSGKPYRRTAGELTRSALITSGGVSQRLEKLEKAGFITRHVDVNDRRRVDVQLTDDGVELVDSVLADLMDHDSTVLAEALTVEEQDALGALLRKLLLSLEPLDPPTTADGGAG
jgi:DNA-binding MarR family transcriptional regulator